MHIREICFYPERYPTAEKYPFNLAIFRQTKRIELTTPATFFVGENGTGKSTLLKAIARRCGIFLWAETENPHVEFNPYEDQLGEYVNVTWTEGPVPGAFFSSAHFQYFSECLEDWATDDPGMLDYFGGQSLLTQSHGQSLMSYFSARYRRKGLYLLDEPETALSPARQLELLKLLAEMGQAGHAQFIVATHSPILLSCPDAVIYSFDRAPVQPVAYKDTEHYRVYKSFMDDPAKFLAGMNSSGLSAGFSPAGDDMHGPERVQDELDRQGGQQ